MAKRIGILGLPNTGKSFSRSFIEDGADCFVISPSDKDPYLRTGGKPVEDLEIIVNGKSYIETARDNDMSPYQLVKAMVEGSGPQDVQITGNHVYVADLNYISTFIQFVAKFMPTIKNLFIADFTHLISNVIVSNKFKRRSSGGEAYARYTDLAGDALNNVFNSLAGLRKDLLVFTEFHCQMGDEGYYEVFLPAGKMLNNSFLPKSYFDIMLCTTVLPYSDIITKNKERYKFVVDKQEPYDARSANLFEDIADRGMIPNNIFRRCSAE